MGSAGSTREGAARLPDAIFAAALVVHVLPVWLLTYFPTQDGPLHVENVLALLRHGHVDVYRQHLVPNWGLQPNWLTQLLFAGLAQVVAPLTAERLVLSGSLLALPLAARFALPPSPRGRWAALAIYPFLYSFTFHMGFWNFTYGLAFLLAILGAWRRTRGRLTPASGAGLALLLAFAYFCHAVAVSASLAAIGVTIAWRALAGVRRAGGDRERRAFLLRAYGRIAFALAATAAPAAMLLARFLAMHEDHHTVRLPLASAAAKLATLYALVSVDRRELVPSTAVAITFALAVTASLAKRWRSGAVTGRGADAWLVAAVAFVVLYFATPDVAAAGAQISDRLALLPFLMLVQWLGAGGGSPRTVRAVTTALVLLSVGAILLRAPRWRELDRDLQEYASVAGAIAPGAVLLPVTFAPYGLAADGGRQAWRVRPFQHAAGYLAAQRDALDLDNTQLDTDHSPLRLAAGPSPSLVLGPGGGLEGDPPCVDLDTWRVAGGALDTVLLFGVTPASASAPCARRLMDVLDARYDQIARSRPRGLVEVYRARAGGTGHSASR